MKPDYNLFQTQIETMIKQLNARIEELALKIVKGNDGIDNFCMAMGSLSFGVDFIEEDEGDEWHIQENWDCDELLKYKWKHEAAIKEIQYIIEEYNDMFHLTGGSIKIDKDAETGTITTVYDW